MTTFEIDLSRKQTLEVDKAWAALSAEGKNLMLAQIHIGWGSLHVTHARLMIFGVTKEQRDAIENILKAKDMTEAIENITAAQQRRPTTETT